jgi:two-component system NtrC family sensor kinase
MRTPRESAIGLLQLMLVALIVLPAILFIFASWLNYRHARAAADERIERSLDILSEHALKVFQTVERTIAEVDEITRGFSDDQIQQQEKELHVRLTEIVHALPQLEAIGILDRNGRSLVTSFVYPASGDTRLASRNYFQEQAKRDAGTYVSEVVTPLQSQRDTRFFVLARRRPSPGGSFNGVTAVAVLSEYFKDFYARIGRAPGSYYSIIRDDGAVLARFPSDENTPSRLDFKASGFAAALSANPQTGLYTTVAQLDRIERRLGYRKLPGFPVYVLAGIETSAIRGEWIDTTLSHLYFGLPATFTMFLLLALALRRTHRLHDEAEKRETAELALRQAQRLEAIGQLTGGVAHDFNNLLMVVSGNVQRLRRELSGEKFTRYLDMIATAAQRGETLTRQLLTFSRRQTLTPEVIDLSRRLPELKEMLSRSLRGDIETEVIVPDVPCTVKVDGSELELALLNLAINAQDAMPNGGMLAITARPVRLNGGSAEDGLAGDFIAIEITDTGGGIEPEIIPKVFEPFFTTKDVGRGTGLGLSQVYGFARQSGGTAAVKSVVGEGTSVTLYLPRSMESPAQSVKPPETASTTTRAGKVLLVEDNAEVADVCKGYFQQLGYQVSHAESAQEALELLENEEAFDLVFSDILMPGLMNGLDLAKAIRDRFPRLPVVLATGYSTSAQDAVRQGFIVVQKPFEFSALDQSIREAMRGKPSPAERGRVARF